MLGDYACMQARIKWFAAQRRTLERATRIRSVVIQIASSNSSNSAFYRSGGGDFHIIDFDPFKALFFPPRMHGGRGTGQSPGVGLVHELGHVIQFDDFGGISGLLAAKLLKSNNSFNDAGEEWATDNIETPFAQEIGDGVRSSYGVNVQPRTVSGPWERPRE